MQLISPRLADDVNHRAGVAAHIGAVKVGLDFELSDRIHSWAQGDGQSEPFVVIHAVEEKVIVAFTVTVGKDFIAGAPVVRTGSAHNGSAGGLTYAIHPWAKRCQL